MVSLESYGRMSGQDKGDIFKKTEDAVFKEVIGLEMESVKLAEDIEK